MVKQEQVPEKIYRFLLTTVRRDGIGKVFIGVVMDSVCITVGELKQNESIEEAIKRLAKEAGTEDIAIKKYLGKINIRINNQIARQFNFEIAKENK